jgi:hypothetical protein
MCTRSVEGRLRSRHRTPKRACQSGLRQEASRLTTQLQGWKREALKQEEFSKVCPRFHPLQAIVRPHASGEDQEIRGGVFHKAAYFYIPLTEDARALRYGAVPHP